MDDVLAEIAVVCRDVDDWLMPTGPQYTTFKRWVCWGDGTDEQGRFLGWCPLHDQPGDAPSALFNFNKGMFWCQADPSCHHPRRAMSIQNLLHVIAVRTLTDNGQ